MNMSCKKQSQFELFPGSHGSPSVPSKSCYLLKDLTLSLENIIVLCIIFVMTLVLFFSFGVERGKRIVKASIVKVAEDLTRTDTDAFEYQASVVEVDSVGEDAPVDSGGHWTVDEEKAMEAPLQEHEVLGDMFTVQVASFKLEKNAHKEATRLKEKGYDIFVLSKGRHSIVCVGKFAQKDQAKQFSDRLKNRYNDLLVRRL